MTWFYSLSNTKSHAELDRLVNDVLLHPEFSKGDFAGFSAAKETKRMDDYHRQVNPNASDPSLPSVTFKDQWIESSVFLSLPCDKVKHASEEEAPKFEVKGLYYRNITEVIKSALSEPAAEKFHLFPFQSHWKPGPDEPEVSRTDTLVGSGVGRSGIGTESEQSRNREDLASTNKLRPHCTLSPIY